MRSRSRQRSPGPQARGSVLDGLRDWLHVCLRGRSWRRRPRDDLVEGALDGERAHPASSLPLSEDRRLDGLWRTWTIACGRGAPATPAPTASPASFTIDRATAPADGVAWELATARGGHPFARTAGPEPTTVCALAPAGTRRSSTPPGASPRTRAGSDRPPGGPGVPLEPLAGAARSPYAITIAGEPLHQAALTRPALARGQAERSRRPGGWSVRVPLGTVRRSHSGIPPARAVQAFAGWTPSFRGCGRLAVAITQQEAGGSGFRREAERLWAAGAPLRVVIDRLRERVARYPARPPSRTTMYRWFGEARWRAGPG